MTFQPRMCPRRDCPSQAGEPFRYRRKGTFQRRCDRRVVARFLCLTCSRGFSEQRFRLDFRLKRPELLARFFADRISKVTHRQSARNQGCSRTTEERHFRRLSRHCEDFHAARLEDVARRGGLGRVFLLDEMETYEHDRLRKPLTAPILVEHTSGFVVDARVGTLPSRERDRAQRARGVPQLDRRVSESRRVVKEAFRTLAEFAPKDGRIWVLTDCKPSYTVLLDERFGQRCVHERTSARRKRDLNNPLWPINHTLARLRDNVSRLVRATWAAAKRARWLQGHIAIWVCYRNYVRGKTNRHQRIPPAVDLGVIDQRLDLRQLLRWRVFPPELAQR